MFSKRWIESPLRRRHLIIIAVSGVTLLLVLVFSAGLLLPKNTRIAGLEGKVRSLKSEKEKLTAQAVQQGDSAHGHTHAHGIGVESGPDPLRDDARVMALRILATDKPLGVKALQLGILESLARIASEVGVGDFAYQRLMESPEKLAPVQRQEETGSLFREDVYRYRFRITFTTDYSGVVAFLEGVEEMSQPVLVQGIQINGATEAGSRIQLDLATYFRQRE